MHTFQKQLIDSGKLPIFEIEVINKKTGEQDYIVCEIEVHQGQLRAFRIGLNEEEEKSDKIAFDGVDIDLDFSLDHHLQELYNEVVTSIIDSDFFELV
jgi:hypothetical protein